MTNTQKILFNWICLFLEKLLKMASNGPYNYSYIFKYIIIGDMGVGKSCILHQFCEKKCKFKSKKHFHEKKILMTHAYILNTFNDK